ncbi:response regulator [Methylomonas sp. SURF-2]|uniref:Response regulator n=1 Tax=Methylomonas subterranea TaxID=2952225 RepID=A0ABT1TIS2_9GAMM|nr:response regulator [Methylomonas sp. SURF-2]MCQ8105106.1 response regulator [Methylomonas sp. SURF-2]
MPYGPVLIVDDEPANLAILHQILKDEHRLMLARNGAEALELAGKHHPCLILLDIQMPEMDGYAVCRALKANPTTEAIPVIFVTTLSELENEEAGFHAGCVDYLIKPVYPRIVRAKGADPSIVGSSQAVGENVRRGHRHARQSRPLQRQRYRPAYLAHRGLRPATGRDRRLAQAGLRNAGASRSDARHRKNRHSRFGVA